MISDDTISVKQEISQISMNSPHVVVLGAGASRATCPDGDLNGYSLPLMRDFVDILGLGALLNKWGIDPQQNFEEVFSDLYDKKYTDRIEEIQVIVEAYFCKLKLPPQPTIYDHLVLSLRSKDLIASFNWDPLLLQAYQRNRRSGLSLPKLAFLHGNIGVGYCVKDKVAGLIGNYCRQCGTLYKKSPLLYPIKKKDYANDPFVSNEWTQLKNGFADAFMITIFGYSGPNTDQEAISAMKEAWGDKEQRNMEQTAFIVSPKQDEDEVRENWKPFIHTHHAEINHDFYDSWIANHPRRTGEAYWNVYLEAKNIKNNPIPRNMDFPKLWKWYDKCKRAKPI